MPRQRGLGKGPSDRFNIRLDEQTAAFYRTKANEHGVSVSEFLRQTLVQGVIAENVHAFETAMARKIDELRRVGAGGGGAELPEAAWLSLFTSEALLTAIVEARDVQALYTAQDRARIRLERLKTG